MGEWFQMWAGESLPDFTPCPVTLPLTLLETQFFHLSDGDNDKTKLRGTEDYPWPGFNTEPGKW